MSITTEEGVRKRIKLAIDDDHKENLYYLRLVVANYLDGEGGTKMAKRSDAKFEDVNINHYEEGRFNPISSNTFVAVERLMANRPEFKWSKIPSEAGLGDTIGAVRKNFFMYLYDTQGLEMIYGQKLFDLLTTGAAHIGCFVRGDACEIEYCDALYVHWDPASKDPLKRRYVVYQSEITLGEALQRWPALAKVEVIRSDEDRDRIGLFTRFWDKDNRTEAVLYKNEFIHGPTENRYGDMLPIRSTSLVQLPSVKHETGIVERQMGSQELALRLQRSFRDTATRGPAVPFSTGTLMNEDQYERVMQGDESSFLRFNGQGSFQYAKGAEIAQTAIEVDRMVRQHIQAESGINEFQMNQTGSNVDFATQLGYLAQQGSARERFISSRIESGLMGDIKDLIMPICAKFWARPVTLRVGEAQISFPDEVPINAMLGSDGEIVMKPGGMQYKAAAQELQETMIFANVLALATSLPPGTQEHYIRLCLDAFEVETPEVWLQDMREAQAQIQAQNEAMMAAGINPQTGQPIQAPNAQQNALPQPAAAQS